MGESSFANFYPNAMAPLSVVFRSFGRKSDRDGVDLELPAGLSFSVGIMILYRSVAWPSVFSILHPGLSS